jgi:N12 class adenine-specific DNA methylase
LKGDKLYRNERGEGKEQQLSKDDHDRVRRLTGIRDTVNDLLDAQLKPGTADTEALRKKLRAAYDAFVRAHGPINRETRTVTARIGADGEPLVITRVPNFAKFRPDPDAWKVAAIERYDAETDTAKPADIQLKDVIDAPRERQVNGPADALAAALDAKGSVDLDHIAESLGLDSHEAVVHALGDLVFLDPDGRQWQTADRYLSGDVVKKLEDARTIARDDKTYQRNVEALEKVQPLPLSRHDIYAAFGAPWVPAAHYEAFFKDVLGARTAGSSASRSPANSRSILARVTRRLLQVRHRARRADPHRARRDQQPAGHRLRRARRHSRRQRQGDRGLARIRTEALKEAFSGDLDTGGGWVWTDESPRPRARSDLQPHLQQSRPRKFDGSHLTFPGLNRDFATRQHRKDAVWRMVQQGNTLLAHVVGSGKTVTMIAGGMEMKRLGLINKPAYVVPNHMLEQFSREFIQAYPNAKILVASKDETSAENRKSFVAKVASNDWDGVIITHDAFGRLNMGKEFRRQHISDQLDELDRAIDASVAEGDRNSPTVKELEKVKKRLKDKLDKLMNEERKDEGVTFEETGIDHLFVDEAHKFKNLSFITRLHQGEGPLQHGLAARRGPLPQDALPRRQAPESLRRVRDRHAGLEHHGRALDHDALPAT